MAAGDGATPITGPNGSATQQVAVTPSDSLDFPSITRGIYVGSAGLNVSVLLQGDTAPVVWKLVPVGIMPVAAKRVYATGTTATDMIALF